MSDIRYRLAERNWITEGTYETWVALLRESRRVGQPIFTASGVIQAQGGCCVNATCETAGALTNFQFTEDGFTTKVTNAINPQIEQTYNIPVGPDDYEAESYPIWDHWGGTIKVSWDDYFDPPCPTLTIQVDYAGIDADDPMGMYLAGIERHLHEYTYEGDSVTNQQELAAAFLDDSNWNY